MPRLSMRFDLRNPSFGAAKSELYRAALDMAAWADEKKFDVIQLSEHHGSEDGYLPSPIVFAAAIAARTKRAKIRLGVVTLPFNNPLRIAEDIAVLDIISGGRVEVVFGAGYAPAEMEMFGVDPKQRGELMEEGITAIKQAWTGEPFTYRGRRALITPTPLQQPRPPIWMGGSSKAAARRAARIADYFYTSDKTLFDYFRECAIQEGWDPGPAKNIGTGFFVATADPVAETARLAPYILHECNSYGRWLKSANTDGPYSEITDVDVVVKSGLYPILSVEQALEHANNAGDDGGICLHPLISGLPPQIGWEHLHFFEREVLQKIRR